MFKEIVFYLMNSQRFQEYRCKLALTYLHEGSLINTLTVPLSRLQYVTLTNY